MKSDYLNTAKIILSVLNINIHSLKVDFTKFECAFQGNIFFFMLLDALQKNNNFSLCMTSFSYIILKIDRNALEFVCDELFSDE